jgi:COP9 signalosome complex subunit 1
MGNEDLGNHYLATGELKESIKAFGRMRDYSTSAKQAAEADLKAAILAIELQQWQAAAALAYRINQSPQTTGEDFLDLRWKLAALSGITGLARGEYLPGARGFLVSDASHGNSFSHVITPNDVAVYGGLCALASMTREQLQKEVLEDSGFRAFLELEPHIRRAITLFCNSKYSQCLGILEAYKTDYLLDVFLQPHLPKLYQAIRSKSIVQYFVPFSCVTLANMAEVFATEEKAMEAELVQMIQQGVLSARIDTQKRVGPPPLHPTSTVFHLSLRHR